MRLQKPTSPLKANGGLRVALLAYAAAMLVVCAMGGWRLLGHSVMLTKAGPRMGEVLGLVQETASVDEKTARELVDSLATTPDLDRAPGEERGEKREAVAVGQAFFESEANQIAERYKNLGADVRVVRLSLTHAPAAIWALINLAAAITTLGLLGSASGLRSTTRYRPPPVKLAILVVGGALGLSTLFCFTIVPMFNLLQNDSWRMLIGSKGRAAWKTWQAWQPLLLGFASLIVMFASVLAVRSEERANAGFRRILHSYAAALNVLLLLAICVQANVLLNYYGVYYTKRFADWTSARGYTLSEATQTILRDLKSRVTFYAVFREQDPLRADVRQMFENFRSVSPENIEFHFIDPYSRDRAHEQVFSELRRKYPYPAIDPSEPDRVAWGVLTVVAVGADKSGNVQEDFEFIKKSELQDSTGPEGGRVFKGERAFISAIVALTAGQKSSVVLDQAGFDRERVIRVLTDSGRASRAEAEELVESVPSVIAEDLGRREARELVEQLSAAGARASVGTRQTIYVTQGNGEPELNQTAVPPPTLDEFLSNTGLAYFKQRLQDAGYTLKELDLKAVRPGQKPRVPRDASIVLVAGPLSLDPPQIEALREYMKDPKHRMLVLLEPRLTERLDLLPTGVEGFLKEFGVESLVADSRSGELKPDLVLNGHVDEEGLGMPFIVETVFAPHRDPQLIGVFERSASFSHGLRTVRTVKPSADAATGFSVKPLLLARKHPEPVGARQWSETDPNGFLRELNQRGLAAIQRRLAASSAGEPICLAVTVRRAGAGASEGEPCMVVIGDVTLATNTEMVRRERGGRLVYLDGNYRILAACLAWLRDRPEQITTIQTQTRAQYTLQPDTAAKLDDIRWYPGMLLILVIVLGGIGVHLIRRR